jgi:CRISPR-associated protein Cmr1
MEWSLSLELLTPAFIGGASSPMGDRMLDLAMPLRPGSVRGLLRYWFRAAAAAVLVPAQGREQDTVTALRAVEAYIFGDTGQASAVVVAPPSGGQTKRWQRDQPSRTQWPGLRYLGYGLFEGARGADALVTPPLLTLGLGVRPRRRMRDGDAEAVRRLLSAALWLWLHLGGIGGRSRRGFGALHLAELPVKLGWPAEICRAPDTRDALIDRILAGLDWVTQEAEFGLAALREKIPELRQHALGGEGRRHREIRTIDGIDRVTALTLAASSGEHALEQAGQLFRDFRSTLRRRDLGLSPLPDYHTVKHALQRNTAAREVYRAAFGLPLTFYFRSLNGARTTFEPGGGYDRVASPLLFRVHRLYPGGAGRAPTHTVVLVNLAERNGLPLLGQGLRQQRVRGAIPAPDNQAITDFIDWALAQSERLPRTRGGGSR